MLLKRILTACVPFLLGSTTAAFVVTTSGGRTSGTASDPARHDPADLSLLGAAATDNENDALLDRAARLRREAEELAFEMQDRRGSLTTTTIDELPPQYERLEDSCWRLTYRFSQDPVDDNDNGPPPLFYTGRVDVRLRPDGYTVQLDDNDDETSGSPAAVRCRYDKFWGWDQETSEQDGLDYLMFSADVRLDDPTDSSHKERYYFNARIERDKDDKELKLTDGTITAKRDVEVAGTGGRMFWGIFNGAGIMAQFRYVGNFSSRPIRAE